MGVVVLQPLCQIFSFDVLQQVHQTGHVVFAYETSSLEVFKYFVSVLYGFSLSPWNHFAQKEEHFLEFFLANFVGYVSKNRLEIHFCENKMFRCFQALSQCLPPTSASTNLPSLGLELLQLIPVPVKFQNFKKNSEKVQKSSSAINLRRFIWPNFHRLCLPL